ncbi:MAG: Na+/H+ antiporter, partial [Gemmatimonadaceae bacterium]|nr:Na+/H+ antiporter [Gemmatimonadaceae bacterium]
MARLELILLLLAVSAALLVPARRWGVPHPVLLVLGGAVLAVIPGLPEVTFDPEVAFVIFVPPLLYRTAVTGSVRDFRSELWAILRLGILLVLVTIGVVAWTAHALSPEFTWGAAFTLAAIVAPPDSVAATAVMRNLDAPGALVSILEGEGLVNDATALVSYRMAVAAVVTGTFSTLHAAGGLLLTGAGGIVVGLIVARVIVWVRGFAREIPSVENTVSVLTPFVAYLPADRLGASGVLSVVACGIYLSRVAPRVVPPATRVQSEAMWSMLNAWLEGIVFILIGLELPRAYRALHHHSLGTLLGWSAIVSAVMILLRLVWVWPSAYIPRLVTRRPGPDGKRDRPLPSWRWVLTVGWAGMRGGDSIVIALALPLVTARGTPFPARDLITFITFGAVFATLVVQGLTLRPFLRLIGLHEDGLGDREELHARRVAAEAG